jgi:hypothetical protein
VAQLEEMIVPDQKKKKKKKKRKEKNLMKGEGDN